MMPLLLAAAMAAAVQAVPAAPELELRQAGSVAPPGKPQTLRCLWRAAGPDGRVAEGSRPGWCAGTEAAIAAEAARRLERR